MRLLQLLFSQVWNCCPLPPPPPRLYFLSSDAPLVPITVFLPGGGQSGDSLQDRRSRSNAPANRSLRRAWDNGRGAGGGDRVFLRVMGRVRGEGCGERQPESESVRMEAPCWAFIPDLAEYTVSRRGSTHTQYSTESTQ